MKVDVLFARFPFQAAEHPAVSDWLVKTVMEAKADPRVGRVLTAREDDTPITMTRNKVIKNALAMGVDLVVMIDSDMIPDLLLGQPDAHPFWPSSFDHWWNHYKNQPCNIFAPYCGPPPEECVYVFKVTNFQTGIPDKNFRIEMFSREEGAARTGFEKVAAGPTGLILIDMRAFKILPKPWFDYEWKDEERTEKASTEDVYFTRNCNMLGIDQICNWNAWAGHVKRKVVSKPQPTTIEEISENMRAALLANRKVGERTIMADASRLPRHLLRENQDQDLTIAVSSDGMAHRVGHLASAGNGEKP